MSNPHFFIVIRGDSSWYSLYTQLLSRAVSSSDVWLYPHTPRQTNARASLALSHCLVVAQSKRCLLLCVHSLTLCEHLVTLAAQVAYKLSNNNEDNSSEAYWTPLMYSVSAFAWCLMPYVQKLWPLDNKSPDMRQDASPFIPLTLPPGSMKACGSWPLTPGKWKQSCKKDLLSNTVMLCNKRWDPLKCLPVAYLLNPDKKRANTKVPACALYFLFSFYLIYLHLYISPLFWSVSQSTLI